MGGSRKGANRPARPRGRSRARRHRRRHGPGASKPAKPSACVRPSRWPRPSLPISPVWIEEPTLRESARGLGDVAAKSPCRSPPAKGCSRATSFRNCSNGQGSLHHPARRDARGRHHRDSQDRQPGRNVRRRGGATSVQRSDCPCGLVERHVRVSEFSGAGMGVGRRRSLPSS